MSTPDERKLLSEDISKAREWIGKYFFKYRCVYVWNHIHGWGVSSPNPQ